MDLSSNILNIITYAFLLLGIILYILLVSSNIKINDIINILTVSLVYILTILINTKIFVGILSPGIFNIAIRLVIVAVFTCVGSINKYLKLKTKDIGNNY